MPALRIARLLDAWRRRTGQTASTTEGTVARLDAERAERRARWEYEDESVEQHDRHGRPELFQQRLERASGRCDALRRDAVDLRQRPQRLADEAEFRRELDEGSDDAS
jgi:hypothetical protein